MTTTAREQPRPMAGPAGRFAMQAPVSKAADFGTSARRLAGLMKPERVTFAAVVGLGVLGVSFTVLGPKILGDATDIIFNGLTGDGIDFGSLAGVLSFALGLYVLASLFSWLQGRLLNTVVQRVVYRLRESVEEKLHRLPLKYFDGQPRGELLSRVTNDIDNISTTLQQTMSQLLTAVLSIIGVTVMMFVISPLLAAVMMLVIPISIALTRAIGKRARRSSSWRSGSTPAG